MLRYADGMHGEVSVAETTLGELKMPQWCADS